MVHGLWVAEKIALHHVGANHFYLLDVAASFDPFNDRSEPKVLDHLKNRIEKQCVTP